CGRSRARAACRAEAAYEPPGRSQGEFRSAQHGGFRMNAFGYRRAANVDEALRLGQEPGAMFIGGGTNLLDLVKGGVATPQRLVDVSRLPLADIAELPDGGVRIGAMARNSDVANHTLVRTRYPL